MTIQKIGDVAKAIDKVSDGLWTFFWIVLVLAVIAILVHQYFKWYRKNR